MTKNLACCPEIGLVMFRSCNHVNDNEPKLKIQAPQIFGEALAPLASDKTRIRQPGHSGSMVTVISIMLYLLVATHTTELQMKPDVTDVTAVRCHFQVPKCTKFKTFRAHWGANLSVPPDLQLVERGHATLPTRTYRPRTQHADIFICTI